VPLALAVLHGAAGARLLPWLSSISSLDDSTCEVRRWVLMTALAALLNNGNLA
jgi:hypothetical protein